MHTQWSITLREISKSATRCHILRLKCTKFDFRWGSAPLGELTVFKGPTSIGEGGKEEGTERDGGDTNDGRTLDVPALSGLAISAPPREDSIRLRSEECCNAELCQWNMHSRAF